MTGCVGGFRVPGFRSGPQAEVEEGYSLFAKRCTNQNRTCVRFGGGSYPNSRSPFTTKLKAVKRWQPIHWAYLLDVGHPIHTSKWFAAVSKYCDVRIVLLHRNFVDTVWSHRTWDTGPIGHGEVLLMFAKFMEDMLTRIPSDSWIRFNYEDFWSPHRDQALNSLTRFLGWEADVVHAFDNSGFQLSKHMKTVPSCKLVKRLHELQISKFMELPKFSSQSQHVLGQQLSTFFDDSLVAKQLAC